MNLIGIVISSGAVAFGARHLCRFNFPGQESHGSSDACCRRTLKPAEARAPRLAVDETAGIVRLRRWYAAQDGAARRPYQPNQLGKLASLIVTLVSMVASHALPLSVETKIIPEVEMGDVEFLMIRYGDEEFSMVPPRGWRAKAKADTETVEIVSPDHSITLRVIFSTNQARTVLASSDALRRKILPEIADAQLIEEFPAYSGDRQGKGVELSFDAQGHAMKCRAAAVPINGGTASFVVASGSVDFEPARQAFGGALTSFKHKGAKTSR